MGNLSLGERPQNELNSACTYDTADWLCGDCFLRTEPEPGAGHHGRPQTGGAAAEPHARPRRRQDHPRQHQGAVPRSLFCTADADCCRMCSCQPRVPSSRTLQKVSTARVRQQGRSLKQGRLEKNHPSPPSWRRPHCVTKIVWSTCTITLAWLKACRCRPRRQAPSLATLCTRALAPPTARCFSFFCSVHLRLFLCVLSHALEDMTL